LWLEPDIASSEAVRISLICTMLRGRQKGRHDVRVIKNIAYMKSSFSCTPVMQNEMLSLRN
jgi:hypothetical protein